MSSSGTTSTIYQYVNLDQGEYSLSMYINTFEAQGIKVYLKAESLQNSAHSVIQEIPVNEYYATVSYAFAGLNFSASPTSSGSKETFKISVVLTGVSVSETQSISIDNMMLSKTTGTAECDLLKSGHFEASGNITTSSFWKILGNESTPITIVDSGIGAFGDVLKIKANVDDYGFVQQKVMFATQAMKDAYDQGDYYSNEIKLFTVSGWGKGTAQAYAGNSLFGIRVELKYYDGKYGKTESYDFDFDKGITDWQFLSGGFTSNPNKGMLESITILLMYNDNPGEGFFDNISLVMDSETTKTFKYNTHGYLSSYKTGWITAWCAYDDADRLVRTISSDGRIIDYEYDNYNRVNKEYHKKYIGTGYCSPSTVQNEADKIVTNYYYSYGYNSFGQHYYTWTYDGSEQPEESVTFTYYNTDSGSHIFGTVSGETNSLWETTRYFYDEANGQLLATVYPAGNGVCYSYDAIGNLTEVLPAIVDNTEIFHEVYGESGEDYSWTETVYGYAEVENSASVCYQYDQATKRLSSISTKSTAYKFTYDLFGNTTKITAGNHTLTNYSYNSFNGKLHILSYGNGLNVKYVYDTLDRISEIQYNSSNGEYETVYSYTYDSAGNLFSVTDNLNHQTTLYKYDSQGKLVKSYVYDTETYLNQYGTKVYYDDNSRIQMVFHYLDYSCPADNYHGTTYGFSSDYAFSYSKKNGNISQMRIGGDAVTGTITPHYDNFGRLIDRVIDFNVNSGSDFYNFNRADAFYEKWDYEYTEKYGDQTGQIEKVTQEIRQGTNSSVLSSKEYRLTYDKNGNITQIADKNGIIQNKYYYDTLGQLIREDNRAANKTCVYEYDRAGNITVKKQYAFTTGTLGAIKNTYSYSYGDSTWGDLLTGFSGDNMEYDEIGNPTFIGRKGDGWYEGYTLQWSGRQLLSYQYSESFGDDVYYGTIYEFTYNADGIRTGKAINGVKHNYYLDGAQIIAEMWTESGTEYLLYYIYDESGAPIGMQYRTSKYASGVFDFFFFEKNVQGDIIGVYNSTGKKIGAYTYDAWGKCSLSGANGNTILEDKVVAFYNPFRYRGYYYDYETGFYYLQSRYYNPEWGRFLNADDSLYSSIFGFNLFAYCDNNPISYIDPYGESGFAAALTGWASSAWGLTLVDGPLPVGDIIYVAGCTVLGALAIVETIMLAEKVADLVQEATDDTPPSTERPVDENGKTIVTSKDPPREEDGYHPPKGKPERGRTKSGEYGWKDKNGNIWVPAPTGSKNTDHGGGHWDVNRPDGKGYTNVYPGGRIRPGKGKIPVFK